MDKPLEIRADDPILRTLKFIPHRSAIERRFERFQPGPGEPQSRELKTPWGEILTARPGDYIVSEMDHPEDRWPVNSEIFEQSYRILRPGVCVKSALTELVPLVELTGDPDRLVTVYTLEGPATVRAGDFYLARGIKGEIWVYPRDKVGTAMIPVE